MGDQRPPPNVPMVENGNKVTVVSPDSLSAFVQVVPSILTPRLISEVSSTVSESGSVSTEEDDFSSFTTDEVVDGKIVRTETVSIHILKPAKGLSPTLDDVSVLPTIQTEKTLRTFENCALSYRFTVDESRNRKMVLSRRDVEIARMKKHYLKLFLADITSSGLKRKRNNQREGAFQTPREKYSRMSLQLWRDACRSATDLYDESLPSLEEATQLFGYGS